MTDLSICIPYYSEIAYLRHCLASLPHRPDGGIEVVVVDDASPHPCAALVERKFPGVRVITNAGNLGFAGAVNVAARNSCGRYLLVLNADTEVLDGIAELVEFLDRHPEVAAVGPQILNPDGSFQPQCRRGRLTPLSGLGYASGLDHVFPAGRLGQYLERWRSESMVQDVGSLSGACMMVRRTAFEQADGFDEAFVLHGEDLDLCYRLGAAGWRIVYSPGAQVIHAGGRGGTARRFYRSNLLYWRALWLVWRRHAGVRGSGPYGWLLAAVLTSGFLGSCIFRAPWHRQASTSKRSANLPPERWARLQRA